MPSYQLPQQPRGPAIWQVQHSDELVEAVQLLLAEPRQRHSQGNAAVQATARIANGMLTIAWEVLVIMVLEPALVGVAPRATRGDTSNQGTSSGLAADGDSNGDGESDEEDDDGGDGDADGDGNNNDENTADDSPIIQGTSMGQAGLGHGDDDDHESVQNSPTSHNA